MQKRGVCFLAANRMSVSKHHSAVAVANCMLLLKKHISTRWSHGCNSHSQFNCDSSVSRAQHGSAGSNPAPTENRVAQVARALHCGCSEKQKYTAS